MNLLLPKSRIKSTGAFALPNVRLLCLFLIIYGFFAHNAFAQTQLPECTANVPFFNLDLSASPNMSYTTPEVERQTGCCGDGDNYISFYVTLNPNVAQFEIVVAPGYADPGGSGNYNIISGGDLVTPGACGVQIPGGAPICITGSGPHKIIYSKPGKNKIKYIFRQIPRPLFPADQSTRIGCSLPLSIFGLNNITISSINSSTGNTTPGAYNSLLSCTNCSNPSFSPGLGTPSWIDYRICGVPQAAVCGVFQSCDTVRLYTYNTLSLTSTPNPATFCQGGGGVLLTASATGGNGGYSYQWFNSSGTVVSTSSTYTATTSGIFTAEVTDGLSTATCPNAFVSVPVTIATTPVVDAGADQIVCATSPTVLLQASSTTGSGMWSGGSGSFQPSASSLITSYTPSASEINGGSATLTFTSTGAGGGCLNTSDQMTITFSDTVVSQPAPGSIACYNGSTTINAGQTGGTAPFTYSWSTGSSGNSISVTAGTYLLTVTDQYGCSGTTPVTVTQPSPLALNMSSTTANSPTCDGTATVVASGGTAPYSIYWLNGETTATADSLCEGIMSVTVVDNNGCFIDQSVVVNNVFCNAFDVGITSSTDVSCHNGNDGSATVGILSGGTAPFTYSWNTIPVQTGATATNLASGTYSVIVTDDSGCQDVATITILQPTIITNTMTHVDASSIGGSDGSATANPLGGTPGYTYLWSPGGQTTQTATNLSSAVGGLTYYVAITDANSCLKTDSVLVNQPPCNDFIASVNTTNVSCNGLTNGAAVLVLANGTPPFSIAWSNGVNNAMSISNLASGNYSVTVTDSKNCSTFHNFTITQPAPLSLSLAPTNVSCNNAGNGTIDLTVSGGTYPYTFTWSVGSVVVAKHEDLIHLSPGTYSVVVVDANGCSISGSVGITQPAAIVASYTYTDNPCYGNSLGSVDVSLTGGTVPYTYAWTGPSGFTATSQDISGLNSGLYQLIITDLHGCSTLLPVDVFINQPEVLSASASMSQEVSCSGGSDGSIALTAEGGTAPYTYAWTGPSSYSSSAEDISGLIDGTYQVTITDAYGCSVITSAVVTTVLDSIPPVVSCTADKFVFTSSSACTYTVPDVSWNATATDDCLLASLVYTLSGATTGTGTNLQGVAFNKGVTSVMWVATDGLGNTDTCVFSVTVTDNVNPVITQCGPSTPASVLADLGVCTYTHSGSAWDVIATDNCGVDSVRYNLSGATTGVGISLDGVVFNLGITTVTWTVYDAVGNSSTCSSTVTVSDNQVPSIVSCGASGPQNVLANAGVCTYTHSSNSWNATATDNCSVVSVTYALSGATTGTGTTLNGVVFNQGTTLVTWTVLDGSGNSSNCTFNVIVGDNQNPVISNCLAIGNQIVNANSGLCTYTHNSNSWNATATDNCTVSSVIYTLTGATTGTGTSLNGVQFNLGITTVTWVATDAAGNTTNCVFTVTVLDTQVPVILSCGAVGNQSVVANTGVCTYTQATTAWNASASDNCSVASVVYVLTGATTGTGTSLAGVAFNLGTTTVTWTATDGSGNTTSCAFNVLVSDSQVPVILSCGASGNQSVVANAGVCTYTHAGTGWNASASDNCSVASVVYVLTGATTGTGTSLAGVVFNLGTTTVTWTATDGSGNTSTCTFNVLVSDNQLPAIVSCGASGTQNVLANAGVCTYTHSSNSWNATATDNCSVVSITYALSGATTGTGTTLNGVVFNQGTTLVTWTVLDGSGNSSNCTFNVIVGDNQNPVITNCLAIGNQIVNANSGLCSYTHNSNSWNATATDNCTVSSIVYTLTGATTGTGTTLNGVQFNLGLTTVTWVATDAAGNTTTCIFTVRVNDTQVPVILSCGAVGNQSVVANAGVCTYTQATTAWNASASDNCSIASVVYVLTGATTGTGTSLAGVAFNLGTTTVTWTATDGSGNVSTCTFNVTVSDNQVPSIVSCGASGTQNVLANTGVCTYTHSGTGWNAVASDNCSVASVIYVLTGATTGTGTSLAGVVFNLGTTAVTWTATDGSGNTSSCSFNVIVSDNQLPSIVSCGASGTQNVLANVGVCTYTHSGTAWNATATDNCSVVSIVYTLSGATSGTGTTLNGVVFNQGTTLVTWTATDGSGNTSSCTFNVIVGDNQNPVISNCLAIGNQIVNANSGVCTYTHSSNSWNAIATDNCTVSSVIYTLTGATTGTGTSLNGVQFNLGITTVTWVATDAAGNTTSCVFTVTVLDTQVPAILSCGASGNQSVVADAGVCTYTQTSNAWNASASDNCSVASVIYVLTGATTGTGTSLNGVTFNLGTTTVTWTATDGTGNVSTCTFNVLVSDNQVPTIVSCGASGTQNVLANVGVCTYTHIGTAWNATATDNCSVVSITYTLSGATTGTGTSLNGVVFNQGTTLVTWTALDGSGNTSICTFNVIVGDNQNPVISNCSGIGNQVVNANTGLCSYTHNSNSWNAIATDNCTVISVIYTLTGATTGTGTSLNGVQFNLGLTTVTWVATDAAGNTTTCVFTVTVNDTQVPVILSCGAVGNQSVVADVGQCTYTNLGTGWNAVASDNCSIASVVYVLTGATTGTGTSLAGVVFNLGTTTVTWTATDGSGNTTSCAFNVLVSDTQLPVITSCGPVGGLGQNVTTDEGQCTYTHSGNGWNAVATDNCTVSSLIYTLTGATTGTGTSLNGVVFNQGITIVTWTATDGSGNTSICSFSVTVTDDEDPVIVNCPQPIIQNSDAGQCGALVEWAVPSFTDNCGATISGTHTSGTYFPVGVSTVSYTVIDNTGNSSSCSFSITIIDAELPVINCPDTIATCDPLVEYSLPTTSDNCGVASLVQTAGMPSGSIFPVGVTVNTFVVTDIHGNTSTCSFTVRIYPTPISATVVDQVSCNGFGDASVDLQLSNGTSPYQTIWSNGAETEDLANLSPGTYTVAITDYHGCTTADTVVITEPQVLGIEVTEDHLSCYNANNGAIQTNVSGGTEPYNYDWSNGQQTGDLANLAAGEYDLTVTDANGCMLTYYATITQPDSLIIEAVVNDATCNAANGSIQLQVTGGTTPYGYDWSNGTSNQHLNNVPAGSYDVVVTDARGCQATYAGVVLTVTNLNASAIITDASCYGDDNGEATVIISNGNQPYTYEWSNGGTGEHQTDLSAGSYSVLITDEFGCTAIVNIVVGQPDSLVIDLTLSSYLLGFNVSTNEGTDGYISAAVFGGTEPYNYFWSTTDTTSSINNLSAGEYLLNVTDDNGCTSTVIAKLTQPDVLEMPQGFSPNADGDNDYFVVHGIKSYPDNTIKVFNRWGNIVYQQDGYADEWYGDNSSGEPLPDATYFVILEVVVGGKEKVLQGYVDLRRK